MSETVPDAILRKLQPPARPAVKQTMEENREVLVRLAKK